MVEWLAGNRIRGTSTERTTGAGFNPVDTVSGGWKELGRTTLGSAGDTVSVTGLADKRYYMLLANGIPSGNISGDLQFNTDTGANYAKRYSDNGGTDGAYGNVTNMAWNSGQSAYQKFSQAYVSNLSSKEKLVIGSANIASTATAGYAPNRSETVNKWANTSNAISSVQYTNSGTGDFAIGSELVVLGWDPADTHTTNFWEELASDENSGSTGTIDTGTFTAKKYLMIMGYCANNSSGNMGMAFNNDLSTNYANRKSVNGGTDSANGNRPFIEVNPIANVTLPFWWTSFVVNNSANEKLVINNVCYQNTAGADTAPQRVKVAGKWANTSSQITRVAVSDDSGSIITCKDNSFLKVWGSN